MRTNIISKWLWLSILFSVIILPMAAEAQPTFGKAFGPDTIGPGSVSTLTFTITNATGTPVQNMGFTDTLPAGVSIADPSNASSNCLGAIGVLSAPAGGAAISLADGSLGGSSTCNIVVDVTSSTVGMHTNTSGALTSSAGNSGVATDDLNVVNTRPGFRKAFAPASIPLGSRSTLTFTIDNSANVSDLTSLSFTDNLPTGLEIADPADASTTCGGATVTLTATPGTSIVSLSASGAPFPGFEVLQAGATCTATVDVIATGSGMLGNSTGELSSSAGSGGKANATLDVTVDTLSLIKEFTDDTVSPGGNVTLEFTITNFDRNNPITNISFNDNLNATLAGLAAVGLPASNVCGAGSTLSGTNVITLANGSLAGGGSCTFSVTLQVPGSAAPGAYPNTTSTITGALLGAPTIGSAAIDSLFVGPAPLLTKEFTDDPVAAGDDVTLRFSITNTSLGSPASDIAFIDELTTFLPFPVSAVLPATPCGAGSSITLISLGTDRQGLSLTNGDLATDASCTFDVTLTVPLGVSSGSYPNTTEEVTATVAGATYTGSPASDALQVVAAPQLSKSFTDDPVEPGNIVTLEFTLSHPAEAPGAATGITFTDDLNAALAGLAAVGLPMNDICGTGSQISGTTNLSFTGGSLLPGDTCTFNITLQTPGAAAIGTYTNTTSAITADVVGMTVANNVASDDLAIASLDFTKEFIDDPVIPGDTATLRFTLTNISATSNATDIIFTDSLTTALTGLAATGLPMNDICGAGSSITGTTFLIFTGGNITAGNLCTFDITVQVPAGAASGTYGNTTSNLSASIGGTPVVLPPATDPLIVESNMLTITKSFTDDPVAPGANVTLEFTLTNQHPTGAATVITYTDDLNAALTGLTAVGLPLNNICGAGSQISGAGNLTLTNGSLAAGASCTFSVTVQTPASIPSGTTATNTTSQVTGAINALPVTGDPATDDLQIYQLNFTKAFSGDAAPGETVTLTFTIENMDAGSGVNDISFLDDLDAMIPGLTATGLPVSDICGAGSQLTGTSSVTLNSGNLGPGGTCTFDVTLQVPTNASPGTFTNTTSDIFSAGAMAGSPASDQLTIIRQNIAGDAVEIPTLGEWGAILLGGLLLLIALWRLSFKRSSLLLTHGKN